MKPPPLRPVAFACILLACAAIACRGDDLGERRRLASEMLDVSGARQAIEESLKMIRNVQMVKLSQMNLSKDKMEKAAAAHKKAMQALDEEMGWDKIREDYVQLYAESFTADELAAIVAFFKSPAGVAMVRKQPELMRKGMEITNRLAARALPRIIDGVAVGEEDPPPAKSAPAAKKPPPGFRMPESDAGSAH